MRPKVAAFSILALGALALLGSLLYRLIGGGPAPQAEIAESLPVGEDPGDRAHEMPRPETAPPRWVAKAKARARSTPRFDQGVFERVGAVERLRQQSKQDGFLFRQTGSDEVFVVQRGTKFKVAGPEELQQLGLKREQIIEVPPGAMDHLSDRPPDRALLRERDDARIYYFEDGVKRWVSDGGAFNRNGFDWSAVRVTPSGSLSAYATGAPVN